MADYSKHNQTPRLSQHLLPLEEQKKPLLQAAPLRERGAQSFKLRHSMLLLGGYSEGADGSLSGLVFSERKHS